MIERKAIRLRGQGVSEGRGRGAIRLVRIEAAAGAPSGGAGSAEEEIQRLHHALEAARKDLRGFRGKEREANDLLEAHILLLEDPVLVDQVESRLRALGGKRRRAEEVLEEVIESFARLFEEKKEPYLRERAADLRDVGRRTLSHLGGERLRLPKDGVLAARDLPPSALLEVKDPSRIDGILLAEGGVTSHVVILSRALGIPAVIGVEGLLDAAREGAEAALDGTTGEVEIHPGVKPTRAPRRAEREESAPRGIRECRTEDGVRVTLRANIQVPVEIDFARSAGAEGVGLYRTEYLRLDADDEKAVGARVEEALCAFGDAAVTIRTADIGGDKFGPATEAARLDLGLRGIRQSLADPESLRAELSTYLAAAKRAGTKNLRILLPMISTVGEADRVRAMIDDLPGGKGTPLGIMVETPAAALTLDLFAERIDFASIGTNDLAQFTMAAERGNARLAPLFAPTQPAFLRLLADAVARAAEARIPLAVCGEMAGDPAGAALLVGLGIRELSASPRRLDGVRAALARITVAEARKRAEALLRGPRRK